MPFIHPTADVQSKSIGAKTRIWQFVVILPGAVIGRNANICAHCLIENDVVLGDQVTVKSGVHLWDGLRVGDGVFIGPNVTFTNDKYPRGKVYPDKFLETRLENGASIGGGAVLLPGIVVGVGALVGAGAVVTRSVPPYAIVTGNPARIVGYVEKRAKDRSTPAASTTPQIEPKQVTMPLHVGRATLHRLKLIRDMRGDLSAGEFEKDIPFKPKRYFMVFHVPSEKTRGEHAHRKCHQFLICIKGGCSVVVDDGRYRKEVKLDSPDLGLHLPPMTWGIQYKYTADAILLVFASHFYSAADYIRDYQEFISLVRPTSRRSTK